MFKKLISKNWFRIAMVVLAILLLQASYMGYLIAATPTSIREPLLEHYHFRMQILVDGKAENFSTPSYQIGYAKDQCNANLPEQPIHFHDGIDQITHIHWEGITGGQVMKYYGWNYIGGPDNILGYRLEKMSRPQKVAVHGKLLPVVAKDSQFYVYTGDATTYKERSFDDWKSMDLEDFFDVTSNFPAHETNKQLRSSILGKILPKAYAHGAVDDGHGSDSGENTDEKLKRINNLIGNVVIFAQKDKPTDQQVKDRFQKLVTLTDSTCGG